MSLNTRPTEPASYWDPVKDAAQQNIAESTRDDEDGGLGLGQFNRLTISEDRTDQLATEGRRLLVLGRDGKKSEKSVQERAPLHKTDTRTERHVISHRHEADQKQQARGAQARIPLDQEPLPLTSGQQGWGAIDDSLALDAVDTESLYKQNAMLRSRLKLYESADLDRHPVNVRFLYCLIDESLDELDEDEEYEYNDKLEILKSLHSRFYTDFPEIITVGDGNFQLHCNKPVLNMDLFLALNKDISFLVVQYYQRVLDVQNYGEVETRVPPPSHESIRPVADGLKKTIEMILQSNEHFKSTENSYQETGELYAPYYFLYHSRENLSGIKESLSERAREHFDLLWEHIEKGVGVQFEEVDALLKQGKITQNFIGYLIKPGDLLVRRDAGEYTGHFSTSWITTSLTKSPQTPKRTIYSWSLKFDGYFSMSSGCLAIEFPQSRHDMKPNDTGKHEDVKAIMSREWPIESLNVFPLRFASENIVESLKRRAEIYMKCRVRRLVAYNGPRDDPGMDTVNTRYMIDMETYHKLHDYEHYRNRNHEGNNIDAEKIEDADDIYQFLLPARVKGYNLRRKQWYEISVDGISDIEWNREAFKNLVMDQKSKELIQALVTSQLESEKSTDLISGKGNGLILLLHGGPGTGKTLTAESVAEIAEKPLYSVTCGDVGTQPGEVEKYLDSVLNLGRIWGCVVLMDEADVFLEQRSLDDLQRNALVSVFLRVLEYYDGILILTSNRVGVFDEAFRSRIQLAMHYPNLGPQQRFKIWQTFIDRLERLPTDEKIDIDDLRGHLSELMNKKLNGRQIRNYITTARQYAKWKNATLTYDHMKDVIEISGRFDDYLDKLNRGLSADEIAQDDGWRLAGECRRK